jgi:hypothetical protein
MSARVPQRDALAEENWARIAAHYRREANKAMN